MRTGYAIKNLSADMYFGGGFLPYKAEHDWYKRFDDAATYNSEQDALDALEEIIKHHDYSAFQVIKIYVKN